MTRTRTEWHRCHSGPTPYVFVRSKPDDGTPQADNTWRARELSASLAPSWQRTRRSCRRSRRRSRHSPLRARSAGTPSLPVPQRAPERAELGSRTERAGHRFGRRPAGMWSTVARNGDVAWRRRGPQRARGGSRCSDCDRNCSCSYSCRAAFVRHGLAVLPNIGPPRARPPECPRWERALWRDHTLFNCASARPLRSLSPARWHRLACSLRRQQRHGLMVLGRAAG